MSKRRRVSSPAPPLPPEPRRVVRASIVAGLLTAFVALALSNALTTSATVDEPIHLAAGYSYLTDADFRLNPEHPPLVKMLTAAPALVIAKWPRKFAAPEASELMLASREARTYWSAALIDRTSQLKFAQLFSYGFRDAALERHGVTRAELMPTEVRYDRSAFINDSRAILRGGRVVALIFGVGLALAAYAWGRRLWGFWGGVIPLALISFDPNFIAHSPLVTTDVAAAAMVFVTIFALWHWSRRPTARRAVLVGVSLGIALLSKFSTVLLLPIGVILVLVVYLRTPQAERRVRDYLVLFATTAAVSFALIWAGYLFRYSAAVDVNRARDAELEVRPNVNLPRRRYSLPGEFPIPEAVHWEAAQREVLRSGVDYHAVVVQQRYGVARPGVVGQVVLFAQRLRILPETYLYGFATARQLSLARQSYLRGEISLTGFRSYFLWTGLLKTPIMTLLALVAGVITVFSLRRSRGFDLLVLTIPVVVFGIVLIQSEMNIGHRHSLPVYPFLFVLAGSVATKLQSRRAWWIAAAAAALLAVSAVAVFAPPWRPQPVLGRHLSYFNELAGGPLNGHRFVVDSNLDWGQDLPALKKWVDRNSPNRPINLNYFGGADPRYHSIAHRNLGSGFGPLQPLSSAVRPGYLVISATHHEGVAYTEEERQVWSRLLAAAEPLGRIGYSLFVYRLR